MVKQPGSRRKRANEARLRERYQALLQYDRDVAAHAGVGVVAGIDEAGRGALAGPVCCAAVILPDDPGLFGVTDSKDLSESERDEQFDLVMARASAVGVALGPPALIDRHNILRATLLTMRTAAVLLKRAPDLILVDGRDIFEWEGRVAPVPKGDATSLCIAAASIVAKVTRDRFMAGLHGKYAEYGFDQHKGYGTETHLEAISRLGLSPAHRVSFQPKAIDKTQASFL